jgi:hypothetical protein
MIFILFIMNFRTLKEFPANFNLEKEFRKRKPVNSCGPKLTHGLGLVAQLALPAHAMADARAGAGSSLCPMSARWRSRWGLAGR